MIQTTPRVEETILQMREDVFHLRNRPLIIISMMLLASFCSLDLVLQFDKLFLDSRKMHAQVSLH